MRLQVYIYFICGDNGQVVYKTYWSLQVGGHHFLLNCVVF